MARWVGPLSGVESRMSLKYQTVSGCTREKRNLANPHAQYRPPPGSNPSNVA